MVIGAGIGSALGLVLVLIFGLDPGFAIGQLFGYALGIYVYRLQARERESNRYMGPG